MWVCVRDKTFYRYKKRLGIKKNLQNSNVKKRKERKTEYKIIRGKENEETKFFKYTYRNSKRKKIIRIIRNRKI